MGYWRPPPYILLKAIAIIRRGHELLVAAVADDTGRIIGWRPLGGSIELGERAEDALRRELIEELALAITPPRLMSVLENIFQHYGATGHEVLFVFEAAPIEESKVPSQGFNFTDSGVDVRAKWVALQQFTTGERQLFPIGLLALLIARDHQDWQSYVH